MIFHFVNILNNKSDHTNYATRFLTTLLTLFFAILQANASYDEPKTYRKQADFKIFFPVNNAVLYAEYKKLADAEEDVIFGGRLGEYKYYDMDKVIESAIACAGRELS